MIQENNISVNRAKELLEQKLKTLLYRQIERDTMSEVKFAIPKGSLEEATFKIIRKAWTKVNRKSRTYRVYLDDPKIIVKMLRPQEIPTLVAEGLYDVGITGKGLGWRNQI